MSTAPILPHAESRPKKTGINIIFGSSVIFVFVTILILVIKGREAEYTQQYIAIGVAILVIMLPTFALLWIVRRTDDIDWKTKYITIFQAIAVMFLCIVPIGALFIGSIYCLTALSHSRNLALDQTDAPLDLIGTLTA